MPLPTKLVNWTYTFNNRISYTSLVQVMRDTIFLVKDTLKAAGYTVKGSCNGVTGALIGSLLVGCQSRLEVSVPPAHAQISGGGVYNVITLDGGLCTGNGAFANPVSCTVATDYDGGVAGTGSAGAPLSASEPLGVIDFGLFQGGDDGVQVFDGVSTVLGIAPGACGDTAAQCYTLTRDVFCHNCVISAGVTINATYRFFDNGVLSLNGTIERNGRAASGQTAGAIRAGGYLAATTPGATGAAAGGAAPVAPTGPSPTTNVCATTGGAGGAVNANGATGGACRGGGGGGGALGGGGGGGTSGTQAATDGSLHQLEFALEAAGRSNTLTAPIQAGSGGGGGRGSSTAAGGGGGGGGGYVIVAARQIVGTGSVEAKGGVGGDGANNGTNTGGGGGGGGGVVVVLIGAGAFPSINVAGGAGGNKANGGGNGGAGGAGVALQFKAGTP